MNALRELEAMVEMAGWTRNVDGWWTHATVGGLHNLKSAAAYVDRWVA